MSIYPFINDPKKHYDCLLAFIVHIVVGVALVCIFGWLSMILVLIVPRFIASAIGSYLFYAQHNFPGVSFNDSGRAGLMKRRRWNPPVT